MGSFTDLAFNGNTEVVSVSAVASVARAGGGDDDATIIGAAAAAALVLTLGVCVGFYFWWELRAVASPPPCEASRLARARRSQSCGPSK